MSKSKRATAPTYTQSPNVFYDEWLAEINLLSELKIVETIIRHTFGWHQDRVKLSLSDFQKLTGMSQPSVIEGIRKAIEHGYIERTKDGQSWDYQIALEEDETSKEFLEVPLKNFKRSNNPASKVSLEALPQTSLEVPLKMFKRDIDKEKEKENLNKNTHADAPSAQASSNGQSGCVCKTPHESEFCDDERLAYGRATLEIDNPVGYARAAEVRSGRDDDLIRAWMAESSAAVTNPELNSDPDPDEDLLREQEEYERNRQLLDGDSNQSTQAGGDVHASI
jgi:hypothetical protein